MKKGYTGLRALIVDDEPLIRFVLTKFLTDNGVNTKALVSAEEAIDEIRVQHYDFCFLDMILPGMNGLEAMKIMNEISPQTKVTIMSGISFNNDMKEQIEELSYSFIEKPFNLSQISSLVDTVAATLTSKLYVENNNQ